MAKANSKRRVNERRQRALDTLQTRIEKEGRKPSKGESHDINVLTDRILNNAPKSAGRRARDKQKNIQSGTDRPYKTVEVITKSKVNARSRLKKKSQRKKFKGARRVWEVTNVRVLRTNKTMQELRKQYCSNQSKGVNISLRVKQEETVY